MALIGCPVNVGQFGTTDKDLDRYKQAGEYALEAKMYRDDSLTIYNELKSDDIQEKIARAEDAANRAETAEIHVADMTATVEADFNIIDGWVKDMSITPYGFTAAGGEVTVTLPSNFTKVSSIYINGGRQEAGDDFTYNATTHVVTFSSALQPGDRVSVLAGTVYEQTSTLAQTLQGLGGADYVNTGSGKSVQEVLNSILEKDLTPEMFGAKGDGTTDDTLAIQAAVNQAQFTKSKLTFNSSKTYHITDTISLSVSEGDVINIDFNGSTIFMGSNKSAFSFQNTLDSLAMPVTSLTEESVNLSVSGNTNTTVTKITSPRHPFKEVGQVGKIYSDDLCPDNDGNNQFIGEWFTVAKIDGDDIYLTGVVVEDYKTNIYICKPSNAKLTIKDLNVKSKLTSGWNASAFTMRGFIMPTLLGNLTATDLNGPFINITGCYLSDVQGTVKGSRLKNSTTDAAFGYLVNDSGSYGTYINNILAQYTRHAFTTSTQSNLVPGDGRWDLRGRSMFCRINSATVQGNACGIDSHATAYKPTIGSITCISDYRGDNAGGVGLQIRANSLKVDSVDIQNPKTGLFISGATKTSDSFVSIGNLRVSSRRGSLPVNIQGGTTNRTKVVIGNLEFETTNTSVMYVKNATVICKYISGEFTPYQNSGNIFELDTNSSVKVLDGNVSFNVGASHRIVLHSDTLTNANIKMYCSGGNRLSYLATSASQYDIQSEFDVSLDSWAGSPFLGLPTTSPKAFAKIRVGFSSYPLRFRAYTFNSSGSQPIDLQYSGDDLIFIRVQTGTSGVVIGSLSRGAFAGQSLSLNNHTNSTNDLSISNSSSNLLSLGATVVLKAGEGLSLVWDGSTWRRG